MMLDPRGKSNIVQLKHAFFFRGHACLVFELLHINLYELSRQLKFNGLSMDMIRRVTIQVLQGLLFLKRQGIIHCDLKPENILLKQEGKSGVKIIDLGSGCFQPEQIYTYIQSRFYRAPEIILGIAYTPAIDIWSMGCILAELFLGYPLFPGESEQEQMLMFIEVLGVPPDSLIQQGSRSHKFFEGGLVRLKPNSKGKIRRPASKSLETVLAGCEDSDFVAFVRRFFVWEP
jgi:dual specificity tyrosine-phosphorylation-regulated kinase 2/3/4